MDLRRAEFLKGAFAFGMAALSSSVRDVLAGVDESRIPLPSYYDSYLDEVAARVNEIAERAVDGFWFLSDLHIPSNRLQSGRAIAALTAKVPSIRKTLCGGDLPAAFSSPRFPTPKEGVQYAVDAYRLCWIEPIESSGQHVYTAKGNHDLTIRERARSKNGHTSSLREARQVVMASKGCSSVVTNENDPDACYYYFDNRQAKIRYIVADTSDSVSSSRKYWAVVNGMGEKQLLWLASNAVATLPENWNAVIMHHIPLTGCVGNEQERLTFASFREFLEAYQNRGKCTLCGKSFDFSSAKGHILLDISGHHHAERQTFQRGILHVTEPCDAAYGDYISRSMPWCGNLPKKTQGTIYEQTFDAVQLDPAHDLVHFTRVGGGQDRSIHTRAIVARVGASIAMNAPLLAGPITWGCYDADRVDTRKDPNRRHERLAIYYNDYATIDDRGVLMAKKPGEVMVVARDAALRKEIFPVRIETQST